MVLRQFYNPRLFQLQQQPQYLTNPQQQQLYQLSVCKGSNALRYYWKLVVLTISRQKMVASFILVAYCVYSKYIKPLTRPFSDDIFLIAHLYYAVFKVCKRRLLYGAVFPEWTFALEIWQSLSLCVGQKFGSRLLEYDNAELFRANSRPISAFLGWIACRHLKMCHETVVVEGVKCEWFKPQIRHITNTNTSATSNTNNTSTATTTNVSAIDHSNPYIVLYLHGGGYAFLEPALYAEFCGRFMREIQIQLNKMYQDNDVVHIFAVDYRKLPEHAFPAPVLDVVIAYQYLTEQLHISPNRIILAGDSAGGGLSLSTLLWIRKESKPLPRACICISPLADLSGFDQDTDHDLVSTHQLAAIRRLYLPDEIDRSTWQEASPVHNELNHLPPLMIQVGDKEMLYKQVLRLYLKAKTDNVQVVLDVYKNMPHIFSILPAQIVPQSTIAIQKLAKFAAFHFHYDDIHTTTAISVDSPTKTTTKSALSLTPAFPPLSAKTAKSALAALPVLKCSPSKLGNSHGSGIGYGGNGSSIKKNVSSMELNQLNTSAIEYPKYMKECFDMDNVEEQALLRKCSSTNTFPSTSDDTTSCA